MTRHGQERMRTVVAVVTVVTLWPFRNCSRSPGRCGHHDRRGRNCDRNSVVMAVVNVVAVAAVIVVVIIVAST